MQLISHRGVKGLEQENTLASIIAATHQPVTYIEFDVRMTSDNILVLHHDAITESGTKISEVSFSRLKTETPSVSTLSEALASCANKKPLVELKDPGSALYASRLLADNPKACATSFLASEIAALAAKNKDTELFLLQHNHPFGLIKRAKKVHATGVGVNKNWALLLPYYYWQCGRAGLSMYTYTVNSPLLGTLLTLCMPRLFVCTDVPQKLHNAKRARLLLVLAGSLLCISALAIIGLQIHQDRMS